MLVDSHCHLDHLDLSDREGGLNGVIDAAQARGITHFLSVAVDMTTSRSLIDLTAQFDNVYSSVGVHPFTESSTAGSQCQRVGQLSSATSRGCHRGNWVR